MSIAKDVLHNRNRKKQCIVYTDRLIRRRETLIWENRSWVSDTSEVEQPKAKWYKTYYAGKIR